MTITLAQNLKTGTTTGLNIDKIKITMVPGIKIRIMDPKMIIAMRKVIDIDRKIEILGEIGRKQQIASVKIGIIEMEGRKIIIHLKDDAMKDQMKDSRSKRKIIIVLMNQMQGKEGNPEMIGKMQNLCNASESIVILQKNHVVRTMMLETEF